MGSLMKQLNKLVGNVLTKIGKFPIQIAESENVADKVNEVKSLVRFQLKKVLTLATSVGHDGLDEEKLRWNITKAVNFLVSLLKKGWNNVGTLHIKTTMSKSYRIFGLFLIFVVWSINLCSYLFKQIQF